MSEALAANVVLAAVEGLQLRSDEKLFFQKFKPAGLTLFARNIAHNPSELKYLLRDIRDCYSCDEPELIVAIDQEGGRVARIRHSSFIERGPMLTAFGRDSLDFAALKRFAALQASQLQNLGINLNFAPVCDVLSNDQNTSIGDRCFARESEIVAQAVKHFIEVGQSQGIKLCAKHFPGQGDATVDAHAELPVIEHSKEFLWTRELRPFIKAIQSGVSAVMVGHGWYRAFDAESPTPASLSSNIITRLLKSQLGFGGLVISDDMQMGAIAQTDKEWAGSLIKALEAGVDLLLVCRFVERAQFAIEVLARHAEEHPSFAVRLQDAAAKVVAYRKSFGESSKTYFGDC